MATEIVYSRFITIRCYQRVSESFSLISYSFKTPQKIYFKRCKDCINIRNYDKIKETRSATIHYYEHAYFMRFYT